MKGLRPARIMIKGGDWISDAAPNPTISGPEITHVSGHPTGSLFTGYEMKKSLTSPGIEFGQISGGQSLPVYFQIMAKGPIGTLSGSFHQEVSIDLICADVPTDLKNALTKGHIGLTRGDEFLQEAETNGDNNDNNTSAKNPNTPDPIPIPYPDTNNTTKAQITTD